MVAALGGPSDFVDRWRDHLPKAPVRRDVPPFTDFRSDSHDGPGPPAVVGVHEAGLRRFRPILLTTATGLLLCGAYLVPVVLA